MNQLSKIVGRVVREGFEVYGCASSDITEAVAAEDGRDGYSWVAGW
jgi:hypothetical protein